MLPRIIHQITGPKANHLVKHCLESWQELIVLGFEIKIWNDQLIYEFLSTNYVFALNAFSNARNHAEAADIARYLIIYHFGGYYMDWDVELLNIDPFLNLCDENPFGYLLIDPPNETLASEVFSAGSGEIYLYNLSLEIVDLYYRNLRNYMDTPHYSGPFRMRDALKKNPGTNQTIIPVKEVLVYDYSEIRQMPSRELTQPMIHYWMHSWM